MFLDNSVRVYITRYVLNSCVCVCVHVCMCVCVFSRCRAGQEKDSLRRQLQDLHKEYSNLVRAMRVTCRHLGVWLLATALAVWILLPRSLSTVLLRNAWACSCKQVTIAIPLNLMEVVQQSCVASTFVLFLALVRFSICV